MTRRYLFTFCSMLLVLGAYLVYARFSQALISPSSQREKVTRNTGIESIPYFGPKVSQEIAETYLPSASWAKSARAKIRADGLHLFFNENRLVNGNTEVEVSPVAMVWSSRDEIEAGEKPSEEPLIILADKATFQLDEAVELSQIRVRLIREISLRGQVVIKGEDGLNVRGSNFVFSRDNEHLRSDHPIEFSFQNHRGSATNIRLSFNMLDGGDYADNPQIESIQDLYIYDHLTLQLQPDGDQPPARISSEGYFRYNFHSHQARFNDDVKIHQKDEFGLVNSLTCDDLILQFAEASSENAPQAPPKASAGDSAALPRTSEIELLSLRAIGNQVVAKSTRHHLEAVGEELTYHLKDRKLTLRKNHGVEIQYLGAELFTPKLEIELDDQREPVLAHCTGPGQVRYHEESASNQQASASLSETPVVLAQANWKDSLTFRPDDESDGKLDCLTLTGKAVLHSPSHQMGIISESIQVWVERLTPDSNENASPNRASAMARHLKLVRTLAEEQVAVVSPYLEGEYESLDVHFHPETAETLAARQQNSSQNSSLFDDPQQERQAPPEPIRFDAKELDLQVAYNPDSQQVHVDHVKTKGAVQARGLMEGQEEPIHLDGQAVEVSNRTPRDQTFHLLGTPDRFASIRSGEMRIDGINLKVDRGKNLTQVMGSGSIQFPVNSGWDGDQQSGSQVLDVSWQEQMKFAGQAAHFIGSVEARLGDAVIYCEQLRVHLDQPVSLQSTEWKVKPQIARVECQDQVRFEMNEYEEGRLLGIRYLNVGSFTVDQQSGAMQAQGPGSMEVWQRRNGKSPLGLPEATMTSEKATAKKDNRSDGKTGWDYSRITFAGQMNGNYLKRQGTLNDRVNILHGPVAEPLDRFDRDHQPARSVWLRSELLELVFRDRAPSEAPEGSDQPQWELEVKAEGNAEIEGDQFRARADLITYDHAPRLFVMRSLKNRHATIWHYEHPQAPRSRYDVKMIRLSPDGQILELDRTRGASGSQ